MGDGGAEPVREGGAVRAAGPDAPARLSGPARTALAVGAACTALVVVGHLLMVFLHVAPENAVSREHDAVIDSWIYPEFEQNWKLFAPNPLQQNIAVHVRARVVEPGGEARETGWRNLSAMDGAAIHHSIAPSHTQQNELRRAWEFFRNSHDEKGNSRGMRGDLSEAYLKRIVMQRIGPRTEGGTVQHIQLRQAITPVKPPEWAPGDGGGDDRTQYRTYRWWQVDHRDVPGGAQ